MRFFIVLAIWCSIGMHSFVFAGGDSSGGTNPLVAQFVALANVILNHEQFKSSPYREPLLQLLTSNTLRIVSTPILKNPKTGRPIADQRLLEAWGSPNYIQLKEDSGLPGEKSWERSMKEKKPYGHKIVHELIRAANLTDENSVQGDGDNSIDKNFQITVVKYHLDELDLWAHPLPIPTETKRTPVVYENFKSVCDRSNIIRRFIERRIDRHCSLINADDLEFDEINLYFGLHSNDTAFLTDDFQAIRAKKLTLVFSKNIKIHPAAFNWERINEIIMDVRVSAYTDAHGASDPPFVFEPDIFSGVTASRFKIKLDRGSAMHIQAGAFRNLSVKQFDLALGPCTSQIPSKVRLTRPFEGLTAEVMTIDAEIGGIGFYPLSWVVAANQFNQAKIQKLYFDIFVSGFDIAGLSKAEIGMVFMQKHRLTNQQIEELEKTYPETYFSF